MSDTENPGFLIVYWKQIAAAVSGAGSFLFLAAKNQLDTRAVKKAVFDDNNNVRLLSKEDCMTCKADHTRELQNIHTAIAETQKTVSDMPRQICEHLKTMGYLK